jgi:hypothetical protein
MQAQEEREAAAQAWTGEEARTPPAQRAARPSCGRPAGGAASAIRTTATTFDENSQLFSSKVVSGRLTAFRARRVGAGRGGGRARRRARAAAGRGGVRGASLAAPLSHWTLSLCGTLTPRASSFAGDCAGCGCAARGRRGRGRGRRTLLARLAAQLPALLTSVRWHERCSGAPARRAAPCRALYKSNPAVACAMPAAPTAFNGSKGDAQPFSRGTATTPQQQAALSGAVLLPPSRCPRSRLARGARGRLGRGRAAWRTVRRRSEERDLTDPPRDQPPQRARAGGRAGGRAGRRAGGRRNSPTRHALTGGAGRVLRRFGSVLGGRRDETCPVSTEGGTRSVQLVREGGRGGGG